MDEHELDSLVTEAEDATVRSALRVLLRLATQAVARRLLTEQATFNGAVGAHLAELGHPLSFGCCCPAGELAGDVDGSSD